MNIRVHGATIKNCVPYGLQTQYTATSCRISSTLLYGARTLAKSCVHLCNKQCHTQNTEFYVHYNFKYNLICIFFYTSCILQNTLIVRGKHCNKMQFTTQARVSLLFVHLHTMNYYRPVCLHKQIA